MVVTDRSRDALLSGVLPPLALRWLCAIARWNSFYCATNGTGALVIGASATTQCGGRHIMIALAISSAAWSTRVFPHASG